MISLASGSSLHAATNKQSPSPDQASPKSKSYFSRPFLGPLRRFVSGNRALKQGSSSAAFDLDMSYITSRILAMSFPASGVEASFRNPRQQVRSYLDQYHEDRYLVFNLCAEKRYQYEARKFAHKMASEGAVCIPVKDHSVPTLYQVGEFCQQAMAWLAQQDDNIVAVHCLNGKGRTGLMIACLLVASRTCNTAPEAIELFTSMRDGSEFMKFPSEKRCVQLFEELLSLSNYSVPLSMTSLSVSRYEWVLLGLDIGCSGAHVHAIFVKPRSAELGKQLELPLLLGKASSKDNQEKEIQVNLTESMFKCSEDCQFTIKLKRGGRFGSIGLKFWVFTEMSQTMVNHRSTSDGVSTVFFNQEDFDSSPLHGNAAIGQRVYVRVNLQLTKVSYWVSSFVPYSG